MHSRPGVNTLICTRNAERRALKLRRRGLESKVHTTFEGFFLFFSIQPYGRTSLGTEGGPTATFSQPWWLYHEKTWGGGLFARELSRSFPLSHHVWGIGGDDVGLIQSTKAPWDSFPFDVKDQKGEVFAYVGRNQNLKDLKDLKDHTIEVWGLGGDDVGLLIQSTKTPNRSKIPVYRDVPNEMRQLTRSLTSYSPLT